MTTAGRLDCTQSYVYRLRSGAARPSEEFIGRLAREYEADEAELRRLAGYSDVPVRPPPARVNEEPLHYELDTDALEAWGFSGAAGMSENDKRILAAAMRSLIEEMRRGRGGG